MAFRSAIVLGAAAALLWAGGSLAAQPARITGTVTDGTRPLESAIVEIFGRKGTVETGPNGTFTFDSLRSGPYWLRVRRIGYIPATFAITLDRGMTRRYEVQLTATPYELPDLVVSGGMTDRKYNDFRWRKRASFGRFYTRDDITRMHAGDLVDVVRRGLPWVSRYALENGDFGWDPGDRYENHLAGYSGRASAASRLSRMPRNCAPAVSVNGGFFTVGNSLRDWRLEDVEAVEVYRGSQVPIEFQRGTLTGCGLVVVWLR